MFPKLRLTAFPLFRENSSTLEGLRALLAVMVAFAILNEQQDIESG